MAKKGKNGVKTGKGGSMPPVEHQFQPGNPGGPGRPRTKPITDALKKISSGPITIKIDGEKRTFDTVHALAQVAISRALKGDLHWWNAVTERLEGKVNDGLDVNMQMLPGLDAETLANLAKLKGGPK